VLQRIRPYQLFTLLDAPPDERIAHVQIPSRKGKGGVSLLESFLLITVTRILSARRIFEIGTFLGGTTFNLALNTPEDAEILTLDLDRHHSAAIQQHEVDASLTDLRMASLEDLDFLGTPVSNKIRTLSGDSTRFNFSEWRRAIDLVFVDGGHDLVTVKSDTDRAFEMVRRERPSAILWHDYCNPNYDYSDLTNYLNELAQSMEIFHVEDTMLCAWFNDPDGSILPKLI
jgi:hypothetical protein